MLHSHAFLMMNSAQSRGKPIWRLMILCRLSNASATITYCDKEKLLEEIRQLENLGVIVQMEEPSDWISGMVATEKKSSGD